MFEHLVADLTRRDQRTIRPGDRFTRLVATGTWKYNEYKNRMYECVCDCGVKKFYRKEQLLGGMAKSCKCLRIENSRERLAQARATQALKPSMRGVDGRFKTQENSYRQQRKDRHDRRVNSP